MLGFSLHATKGASVSPMTDLKAAANVMREQALLSPSGQGLDYRCLTPQLFPLFLISDNVPFSFTQ